MPPATTREQFRAMLRNLLVERFRMGSRRETRELAGFALTPAKAGAKLKAAAPVSGEGAEPVLKSGADGFFVAPERPGMFLQLTLAQGVRCTFRQTTMTTLAAALERWLKRPVEDATGLPGAYDFRMDFASEGLDMGSGRIPVSAGSGETPPDLHSALASLGLKLEGKKTPVEMVVIEHVERTPTAN
jgi:uncharacterized protein (TIGR03435 family)